jgi:uncharacterized protein
MLAAFFLALKSNGVLAHDIPTLAGNYTKIEYRIPMRDGVRLYTAVYVPKLASGKHPILMERTPYSAGPYGSKNFGEVLGSPKFKEKGYIFAVQDVRGQFMSEGVYENIRPFRSESKAAIDESTDAYDTIEYLVKNVPDNNGKVGMLGISYPGFYAAAGAVNSHPALKAVSPQAPVSDWFKGDDVHHNGAFFVQDNFDFIGWFDYPRKGLEENHKGIEIEHGKDGGYQFYLDTGTMVDFDRKHFKGRVPYWNEVLEHDTYDAYWQQRSLPLHLKNVKCAVMTVGGWFDAEDQWGALNDYPAFHKWNPTIPNYLVMGPWFHGMWADGSGQTFGDLDFGMPTSRWYRDNVEFPFFEKYLREDSTTGPAPVTVFETGANKWHSLTTWPPRGLKSSRFYLGPDHQLLQPQPVSTRLDVNHIQALFLPNAKDGEADSYENDSNHPTPYLADPKLPNRPAEYMVADQRFAEKLSDVLTYSGTPVKSAVTYAGPIDVDLWVTTTGTDADFIVKVIDVWPSDSTAKSPNGTSMAGYEQFVRGDVMRGKFRNSLSHPEPFVPGKPTAVRFKLNDIYHTLLPGHRLMVQIQSSWFPLVDRNPNKFVNINRARSEDFQKATISILRSKKHPSSLTLGETRP